MDDYFTLVPGSIGRLKSSELSAAEKLILCDIVALSQKKPCTMSNATFAERFGISTRQITSHIKKLSDKGWIEIGGTQTKRYIKPTEKTINLWKKTSTLEETFYRRNLLPTIEENFLNSRRNLLPKIKENKERINISHARAREESAKKENHLGELFDQFYAAYPRKVAKKAAQKAFAKIKDAGSKLPAILQALEKQKAEYQQQHDFQRDGWRFFPHPATWLNREQWEDETETAAPSQPRQLKRWTQEDERREGEKAEGSSKKLDPYAAYFSPPSEK